MQLLSLAKLQATMTLLTLLLLCSPVTRAFDGRLSLGTALDTSDKTMRNEFPASIGDQLHLAQFPLQIYGTEVVQLKASDHIIIILTPL